MGSSSYVPPADSYGNPSIIQQPSVTSDEEKAGFGMYSSGTGTGAYTGGGGGLAGIYGSTDAIHQLPLCPTSVTIESEEGIGERRRGIKEKIIENLPGTGHHTTPTGVYGQQQQQEASPPKGIIQKIKEKLPGHHH